MSLRDLIFSQQSQQSQQEDRNDVDADTQPQSEPLQSILGHRNSNMSAPIAIDRSVHFEDQVISSDDDDDDDDLQPHKRKRRRRIKVHVLPNSRRKELSSFVSEYPSNTTRLPLRGYSDNPEYMRMVKRMGRYPRFGPMIPGFYRFPQLDYNLKRHYIELLDEAYSRCFAAKDFQTAAMALAVMTEVDAVRKVDLYSAVEMLRYAENGAEAIRTLASTLVDSGTRRTIANSKWSVERMQLSIEAMLLSGHHEDALQLINSKFTSFLFVNNKNSSHRFKWECMECVARIMRSCSVFINIQNLCSVSVGSNSYAIQLNDISCDSFLFSHCAFVFKQLSNRRRYGRSGSMLSAHQHSCRQQLIELNDMFQRVLLSRGRSSFEQLLVRYQYERPTEILTESIRIPLSMGTETVFGALNLVSYYIAFLFGIGEKKKASQYMSSLEKIAQQSDDASPTSNDNCYLRWQFYQLKVVWRTRFFLSPALYKQQLNRSQLAELQRGEGTATTENERKRMQLALQRQTEKLEAVKMRSYRRILVELRNVWRAACSCQSYSAQTLALGMVLFGSSLINKTEFMECIVASIEVCLTAPPRSNEVRNSAGDVFHCSGADAYQWTLWYLLQDQLGPLPELSSAPLLHPVRLESDVARYLRHCAPPPSSEMYPQLRPSENFPRRSIFHAEAAASRANRKTAEPSYTLSTPAAAATEPITDTNDWSSKLRVTCSWWFHTLLSSASLGSTSTSVMEFEAKEYMHRHSLDNDDVDHDSCINNSRLASTIFSCASKAERACNSGSQSKSISSFAERDHNLMRRMKRMLNRLEAGSTKARRSASEHDSGDSEDNSISSRSSSSGSSSEEFSDDSQSEEGYGQSHDGDAVIWQILRPSQEINHTATHHASAAAQRIATSSAASRQRALHSSDESGTDTGEDEDQENIISSNTDTQPHHTSTAETAELPLHDNDTEAANGHKEVEDWMNIIEALSMEVIDEYAVDTNEGANMIRFSEQLLMHFCRSLCRQDDSTGETINPSPSATAVATAVTDTDDDGGDGDSNEHLHHDGEGFGFRYQSIPVIHPQYLDVQQAKGLSLNKIVREQQFGNRLLEMLTFQAAVSAHLQTQDNLFTIRVVQILFLHALSHFTIEDGDFKSSLPQQQLQQQSHYEGNNAAADRCLRLLQLKHNIHLQRAVRIGLQLAVRGVDNTIAPTQYFEVAQCDLDDHVQPLSEEQYHFYDPV